ncbi:MAG: PEP-CTERM sorting domain-containing protein [Candidatus Auribacterota bacterium]
MKKLPLIVALCFSLSYLSTLHAAIHVYTEESDYLNALQNMGYASVSEGFEDDTAWGGVRSVFPNQSTAPTVTSQWVTWQANNANSEVTTGAGAALNGNWGFYTLPHGDFANGIGDGFFGQSSLTLYGVGGWVDTNTPFASVEIYLDGDTQNPVDFGDRMVNGNPVDASLVGTMAVFFGVIDTDGFSSFLFQEVEGTPDDMKFIFADDFTFGFSPSAIPEPSAMLLFGTLGAVFLLRRRK